MRCAADVLCCNSATRLSDSPAQISPSNIELQVAGALLSTLLTADRLLCNDGTRPPDLLTIQVIHSFAC
jgi:hypothetical protein